MKNILQIIFILFISSCTSNIAELKYEWHIESNDSWYELTRTKIIEQSNQKNYKTSDIEIDGVRFLVRKYHDGEKEFRREFIDNSGKIRGVQLYAKNGDFELRNEIHENGRIAFEGIVYKGEFYGLSRW